jgi:hypothetical protein
MKITLLILLSLFACTGLYAQDAQNLFTANPNTDNISSGLERYVESPVILKLDNAMYSRLFSERNEALTLRIPLKEQAVVTVNLKRFEVLAPGAKIVARTGNTETEVPYNNLVLSYTGKIDGLENSFVSLSFYNGKVVGVVMSNRDTYVLGKLGDEMQPGTDYVIYQESRKKEGKEFKCGSESMEIPERVLEAMRNYNPDAPLGNTIRTANIAIDIDNFTYGTFQNSVPNATAWGMALMSAVSSVYLKDMNIYLQVGYLRVWTTPDPYTSTSGNGALNQFRSEWINTQSGVQRTVAHLLSKRNNLDVAGIAYVDVLCNTTFGYGLSATLNGQINPLPTYSYDVVVTAHELGHNFGSPHTHSCSWVGGPLDTCYEIEGGCYSGPTIPTAGSIMSYCDIVGGGSIYMDFDSQPEALIRGRAESAGCMDNSTATVIVAQPNGGETYRTGATVPVYWGTSLAGNVNVEYSSNNGASWNTIQNNVPAQNRFVSWVIPYIASTTTAKVRVINSSNPAEGDTTNSAFRIILNLNNMTPVSPPTFSRVEVSPTDPTLVNFTWGSAGTHPTIRYTWKIKKGTGTTEFTLTSNNNGVDTVMSVRKSQLDSMAAVFGTTGDSVLCTWRGWAYNGIDSLGSNPFIIFLKRTSVGIQQISSEIPAEYRLFNNYPNPFNPETSIKFDIPKANNVELRIYDMKGSEVAVLINGKMEAGSYKYRWNASAFPSGVYFYRLKTADFTDTKRMILVK